MTHVMRNICIFILCFAALSACNFKKSEESPAPQPAPAPAPKVAFMEPAHPGVYYGDASIEIAAGQASELMPTNADRGFGFGRPAGTVLAPGEDQIAISLPGMETRQLQVTRYTGVAVNSVAWGSDVDDSNVAWLPNGAVPTRVRVDGTQTGVAVLEFSAPLEPGFYVLHDESMLRAGDRDDVTFFYPFAVSSIDGKLPWRDKADQCFRGYHAELGASLPMKTPKGIDRRDVADCALAQRIAWKAAKDDAKDAANLQLRTVYLARLFDADNLDTVALVNRHADANGAGLAEELWRIARFDRIRRLDRLYAQSTAGEALSADTVAALQASYRNGIESSDDPRLREPIGTLGWVPFAHLEMDEPLLQQILADAVENRPWERSLIVALGAIEYRALIMLTRVNMEIAAWFKDVEAAAPAVFRDGARDLSFRNRPADVAFGPYRFAGVPSGEESAWKATLKTREGDAAKCFRGKHGEGALLILEQPLTRTSLAVEPTGILRDPYDARRSRPSIDPADVSCVLHAYAKIPALLTLDTTQKAYIAIAVH